MNKLQRLKEEMTAKLTRLGELQNMDTRSTEQESEIDTLLGRVNEIGPEIQREQQIAAATADTSKYTEPVTRGVSGINPRGEQGEGKQIALPDHRSLGRRYVESAEYKDYAADPRGKGEKFEVRSFHSRSIDLQHREDMSPEEVRTLVYTGVLPVDMILPQQVPGVFRGADRALNIRDVLINGQTNSDAVTFMRELVYTNAAVEVAQAVSAVTGAKPESAITFEQATSNVVTIAHWIPITRQTMQDAAQLVTYINERLLFGLKSRENNQLLNGDGTGANMLGILATTGVQAINAAHFTATPTQNVGTKAELTDRIRRGKRMVRVTGQANPNFVVIHPTIMEKLETIADGANAYVLGNAVTNGGLSTLWGMTVVESEDIATTVALVGDGSAAAVWDRMDAQLFTTDSHSDFFIRNIFVILAEERLALTVFRPTAFAVVTLP
jgi:HK97 family phage major capsid protein